MWRVHCPSRRAGCFRNDQFDILQSGAAWSETECIHTNNDQANLPYSSMMLLAAASLAVPSAFSRYFAPEGTIRQEELLNLGIAGVLLLTYALYLLFSLKTHSGAFANAEEGVDESHSDDTGWSMPHAILGLAGASVLAAWMSEILVG